MVEILGHATIVFLGVLRDYLTLSLLDT